MKFKPARENSSAARDAGVYDARIDAALRVYGRAVPTPGLESRVAARISATPRPSLRSGLFGSRANSGWILVRGFSVGALAAAAACAIILGTLQHSKQGNLPQSAKVSRSGGVSAAGAAHVPTRAIPQSATIDPQAPRSAPRSRAAVSPNKGSKPAGSATPRSPYPPDQSVSTPQQ